MRCYVFIHGTGDENDTVELLVWLIDVIPLGFLDVLGILVLVTKALIGKEENHRDWSLLLLLLLSDTHSLTHTFNMILDGYVNDVYERYHGVSNVHR